MKRHFMVLVVLLVGVLLSACASGVHDVPPTKGGTYTRTEVFAPVAGETEESPRLVRVVEAFAQGENADAPSTFERGAAGGVKVRLGANRENLTSIAPAADYVPYVALVVSLAMFGGGLVLVGKGWPQIGGWLAVGGAAGAVVSLTVRDYGWVYVAAILAGAGVVAWEKLRAYRKGEEEVEAMKAAMLTG